MTTQIMKPSDDAKTRPPARVQSAAPSPRPTTSTATPPAAPARPNHFRIFRARGGRRGRLGRAVDHSENLERHVRRSAEDDNAREEAVWVEPDQPRSQTRDEPEVRERRCGDERRFRAFVLEPKQE